MRKVDLSLAEALVEDGGDDLNVARLGTMTALDSLRAVMQDVRAVLTAAAPALSWLTCLVGMTIGDEEDVRHQTRLAAGV